MNLLILAAGSTSATDTRDPYPLCLVELDGQPLIERTIRACETLADARFIVALRDDEIRRHHLDSIVTLLAPGASVIRVANQTGGAACTALLAIGQIDSDEELLILNANELLEEDFARVIDAFRARNLDAGTVTFPSVHPRYSYVRLNADGFVVEAAEKKPLSRQATVGFYWFARGKDFVRAAQNMIRKDAAVNDLFYICPTLNELVLEGARIGTYAVEGRQYSPLKTERQLLQYESLPIATLNETSEI